MARQLTTTAYLVLRPSFSSYTGNVSSFHVEAVRKKRPTGGAASNAVVLALTLRMPEAAFEPLRPEVTITVPEGAYEIVPEVTVDVPPEPEEPTT